MALKQQNPALFNAINALKAKSFIYSRGDTRDFYNTLLSFREDVNDILAYDNCEMRVNTELETIKIHFIDAEEGEPDNLLRAKFNAGDMKVYSACLTLYNERFVSSGAYIEVSINDVINCLEGLNLVVGVGRKKGSSARKDINDALDKLDRYGMITFRKLEGSILLKPGITMGLDRETFMTAYDEIVASWTNPSEKEEEEEND